mgnify:CR=1 FL=1|tara:strand:+ start:1900 stop:2358 length:459 start_codon:yes stop_codon:yes gene_type:complete
MKKIFIFIFLFTISCSNNKVVKNHGFIALESKAEKIHINKSNKNDLLINIGKPSTKSLFDQNTWYYLERESINQSIFKLGKSKLTNNNVLEVKFNNQGIVNNIKLYKIENMNDIKITKDTTNNTYQNNSYLGKVLNSVKQKIEAPKLNRKRK